MSKVFVRLLFLSLSVPFSKGPKCCKSWLDEDVKEATKAFGNPNTTRLEFIYGIMESTTVVQINHNLKHPKKHKHNKLMFHGLKSIARDTCVTKCHLEADWTTQRLPIKSHAVFIEEVPCLDPPAHQPHKFRSCDLWVGVPFRKLLRLKRTRAWTKKKQGCQTAPEENVNPNS